MWPRAVRDSGQFFMIDTSNDRFELIPVSGCVKEWSAEWIPAHYALWRTHMVGHPTWGMRSNKYAVAAGSREAMVAAKRLLGAPDGQ